jgi:hypothetical protein
MGDAGGWNWGVDGDTVCAQQVMDGFISHGEIQLYFLGRQGRHVAVDAIIGQYESGMLYPAGVLCSFVVAGHTSLRIEGDPARLVVVHVVTG